MLVLGLLVLAAAVVVGAVGVASNTGTQHQLPDGFSIFGYHIHGSVGKLFFAGLMIGAIGMIGLVMVLDGLRRNAALRRELLRFRREARSRRTAPAAVAPATQAPASRTPEPQAPAPAARTVVTREPVTQAPVVGTTGDGTTSARTSLRRGLSGLRPSRTAAAKPAATTSAEAEDRNVTSAS